MLCHLKLCFRFILIRHLFNYALIDSFIHFHPNQQKDYSDLLSYSLVREDSVDQIQRDRKTKHYETVSTVAVTTRPVVNAGPRGQGSLDIDEDDNGNRGNLDDGSDDDVCDETVRSFPRGVQASLASTAAAAAASLARATTTTTTNANNNGDNSTNKDECATENTNNHTNKNDKVNFTLVVHVVVYVSLTSCLNPP